MTATFIRYNPDTSAIMIILFPDLVFQGEITTKGMSSISEKINVNSRLKVVPTQYA